MICELLELKGNATLAAAILAAIIGVVGWLVKSLVSAVLHYHRKYTAEIELMTALKAEIFSNTESEKTFSDPALLDTLRNAYAANAKHKLYVPLYRQNIVFDVVKQNISAIPEAPMNAVIKYYNVNGGFDVSLARLEDKRFEGLPNDRKIKVFESVMQTAAQAVLLGEEAITALVGEIASKKRRQLFLTGWAAVLVAAFTCAFAWYADTHQQLFSCHKQSPGIFKPVTMSP